MCVSRCTVFYMTCVYSPAQPVKGLKSAPPLASMTPRKTCENYFSRNFPFIFCEFSGQPVKCPNKSAPQPVLLRARNKNFNSKF